MSITTTETIDKLDFEFPVKHDDGTAMFLADLGAAADGGNFLKD